MNLTVRMKVEKDGWIEKTLRIDALDYKDLMQPVCDGAGYTLIQVIQV